MHTQTFLVCHVPSKPLCSGEMHDASATEITVIWEKKWTLHTEWSHPQSLCTLAFSGNVSPEGGVPWFKPSTPGPCSHLPTDACLSLLFPSGTQPVAATDHPPRQSRSLMHPVPWLDFITVMKTGAGGSIPFAMKTFLLYILITFHFFMIIKRAYQFFQWIFMEF